MQTIFKRNDKSGFTLIELMVVVVLVIILALALVPTFKELITKAKYTEGISAISAITTKMKVYQVEKTCLPGCVTNYEAYGTSEGVIPGTPVTAANEGNRTQRFVSSTTNYLYTEADPPAFYSSVVAAQCPVQLALDIDQGDYDGKYFATPDYQVRIDCAGIGINAYQYTVAVTGNGAIGKAPIGTAYAVMTYYNPSLQDEEKMIVSTFSRYKPRADCAKMVLQGTADDSIETGATRIFVPDFMNFASNTVDTRAECKIILEAKGFTMD